MKPEHSEAPPYKITAVIMTIHKHTQRIMHETKNCENTLLLNKIDGTCVLQNLYFNLLHICSS